MLAQTYHDLSLCRDAQAMKRRPMKNPAAAEAKIRKEVRASLNHAQKIFARRARHDEANIFAAKRRDVHRDASAREGVNTVVLWRRWTIDRDEVGLNTHILSALNPRVWLGGVQPAGLGFFATAGEHDHQETQDPERFFLIRMHDLFTAYVGGLSRAPSS